jgi:hypothetical protein
MSLVLIESEVLDAQEMPSALLRRLWDEIEATWVALSAVSRPPVHVPIGPRREAADTPTRVRYAFD